MDPITMIAWANAGIDLIISIIGRLSGPKAADIRQRLIEVKGLSALTGTILLTPNERRVAEDRRDCYWLYIVTNCGKEPVLQEPILDPAKHVWNEVKKVQHSYLRVDAMTRPMRVREKPDTPFGGEGA